MVYLLLYWQYSRQSTGNRYTGSLSDRIRYDLDHFWGTSHNTPCVLGKRL